MAVYFIILAIAIVTTNITVHGKLAYGQDSVSITCGPTQQSNLSVSMNIDGFLPKTFMGYKFIRPDNSVVYGGFSTGSYGKNTVDINVGPKTGPYLLYIYKDMNSGTQQEPVYFSTITLPCVGNHFAAEYYKSHPRLIEYLLGIRSIYNTIKIGDYLVASPRNALEILNSSNSNFAGGELAAQLLTAELNAVNGGASECIGETMSSSNSLLKSQNYNGPNNLIMAMNQDLNSKMLSLKDRLETYNRVGCSR
ncbi:MAG: hypothetical protein WBF33_06790 [Candidatus Nitrosopolaris sp.]|jgi:hypothetical protein